MCIRDSLIAIVNHPEKFRLDYPESETNGANTVVDGQPVPYADNKERRDYILDEMLKLKKITQEDHDAAVATPGKKGWFGRLLDKAHQPIK